MLRLGNLTFRASRRTRRARKNGTDRKVRGFAATAPNAPEVRRTKSPKQSNSDFVPMIDQKIANLEAELTKLKKARELLA